MKKTIISSLSVSAGILMGFAVGGAVTFKAKQKEKEQWKNMSNKHLALMLLLNQWLITRQEGKSVVEYFHKNGIRSIAIYGMSYIGERLYDELKNSDIDVRYAIDRNAKSLYADIDIIVPDEKLPKVDAIIVTPVFYFYEIEEMLSEKVDYKVISLGDLLHEI